MARPQKVGVEYFPLDVDIDQDDKVAIIEAQHGIKGFGIVIKLLMHIYKNGYYYEWTEKEQLLFSKRVNVDINEVNVIINDCIKWGLFDERLFKSFKILTSRGIQKRYFEIVKRRQRVEVIKEYLLLDNDDINIYSNLVIVSINDNTEEVNVIINPQSKVKESKEKKSKGKNDARAQKPKPEKIKYADFVSLTNAEYKALVAKLGEEGTKRCIEILDNYKGATGKKYKSDYRAILNWVVERYEEEQRRKQHDKPKASNPFLELAREEGLL
jgi:hypothetical protein